MMFALITTTRLVSTSELYRLKPALEINAGHLAAAYLMDEPIAIEVIDREADLPSGCYPVVFVDDGGDAGTLAEHWFDPLRDIPASRVYVENVSALNTGPYSASEAASHEILEAIVDPMVATWKPHPRRPGVDICYEVADPCQDTYSLRANGTDWLVSNFATPFFWMHTLPQPLEQIERDFGYGIDWCKRLREPGEIGPEGYAVLRESANHAHTWTEDESGVIGQNSRKLDRKQHRWSRTQRRLRSRV